MRNISWAVRSTGSNFLAHGSTKGEHEGRDERRKRASSAGGERDDWRRNACLKNAPYTSF